MSIRDFCLSSYGCVLLSSVSIGLYSSATSARSERHVTEESEFECIARRWSLAMPHAAIVDILAVSPRSILCLHHFRAMHKVNGFLWRRRKGRSSFASRETRPNCLYVCRYWYLTWNTTNMMRSHTSWILFYYLSTYLHFDSVVLVSQLHSWHPRLYTDNHISDGRIPRTHWSFLLRRFAKTGIYRGPSSECQQSHLSYPSGLPA